MIKFPVKLPLHSIDITGWDLNRLDPRKALSRIDLGSAVTDSSVTRAAGRAATQARDVALTAVGFTVLASQKIQVRRRELFDALSARRSGRDDAGLDGSTTTSAQSASPGTTDATA